MTLDPTQQHSSFNMERGIKHLHSQLKTIMYLSVWGHILILESFCSWYIWTVFVSAVTIFIDSAQTCVCHPLIDINCQHFDRRVSNKMLSFKHAALYPTWFSLQQRYLMTFICLLQNTVDKLIKKTNLSLVVGTSSWREQFVEALTVSAGESTFSQLLPTISPNWLDSL